MILYELKTRDPYLNLAIEEYIFNNCSEDVFILWQNDPCVVIGKNQNPYAEINPEFLFDSNIKIARRITGGGAVFHDGGNVNYTFISPAHSGLDFAHFTKPIIDCLGDIGVRVSLSGRNDLVLENGKKVSGNAQYNSGGRVLHHGTLLFKSDLNYLDRILKVDPEKLKSKSVRSVLARVGNISDYLSDDVSVEEFISLLRGSIIKKYSPKLFEAPAFGVVEELYNRNRSREWIFSDKKTLTDYSVVRSKRFDFGSVQCQISLSGTIICDLKICGDFFEKKPVSELEHLLIGIDISLPDLGLSNISVGDYIMEMNNSNLCDLILGK